MLNKIWIVCKEEEKALQTCASEKSLLVADKRTNDKRSTKSLGVQNWCVDRVFTDHLMNHVNQKLKKSSIFHNIIY